MKGGETTGITEITDGMTVRDGRNEQIGGTDGTTDPPLIGLNGEDITNTEGTNTDGLNVENIADTDEIIGRLNGENIEDTDGITDVIVDGLNGNIDTDGTTDGTTDGLNGRDIADTDEIIVGLNGRDTTGVTGGITGGPR